MIKLKVQFYNRPLYLPIAAKILPKNIVEFTLPNHVDLPEFQKLISSWDSSGREPHIEVIRYE